MNMTGRGTVAGTPSSRMYCSSCHLISQCGIPVARSALATEA